MTNFQVFRKTVSFSFVDFLVGLLALAIFVGCCTIGFVAANGMGESRAFIGLIVGGVIGIILDVLINYLISNRIKAAQISMIVKGVNEGELPEHTFKEGFNEIKGRFGKITLFFFITNAIKSVFRQLGRAITKFSSAVGGEVGGSIASIIDSAIQTLISYLCDCCLGWVLFRKEENAAAAACEGAVIFFKHGKTLIRNVGRIFGMGALSFILIGGGLFGALYGIFSIMPNTFAILSKELVEALTRSGTTDIPEFLSNPAFFMIVIAAIGAVVLWSMIHSVVGRPFILVGVMRNFMEAGKADMPTEADIVELEKKAPKLAKLRNKSI